MKSETLRRSRAKCRDPGLDSLAQEPIILTTALTALDDNDPQRAGRLAARAPGQRGLVPSLRQSQRYVLSLQFKDEEPEAEN